MANESLLFTANLGFLKNSPPFLSHVWYDGFIFLDYKCLKYTPSFFMWCWEKRSSHNICGLSLFLTLQHIIHWTSVAYVTEIGPTEHSKIEVKHDCMIPVNTQTLAKPQSNFFIIKLVIMRFLLVPKEEVGLEGSNSFLIFCKIN